MNIKYPNFQQWIFVIIKKQIFYLFIYMSDNTNNYLINLFLITPLSSALSSSILNIAISPYKILIQKLYDPNRFISINGSITQPYSGVFDCAFKTIKKYGFLGLWKGNLTNFYLYVRYRVLTFTLYQYIKSLFYNPYQFYQKQRNLSNFNRFNKDNQIQNKNKINTANKNNITKSNKIKEQTKYGYRLIYNMISGSLSGSIVLCLFYPFSMAKKIFKQDQNILFLNKNKQYNSLTDVYKKNFTHIQGIKKLYSGFKLQLLSQIIQKAFYFGLFDSFNQVLIQSEYNSQLNKLFLAWICAKVGYDIFDIVRHNMSVIDCERTYHKKTGDSLSILKQYMNKNGFKSLVFTGSRSHVYSYTLQQAIVMVIYLKFKSIVYQIDQNQI